MPWQSAHNLFIFWSTAKPGSFRTELKSSFLLHRWEDSLNWRFGAIGSSKGLQRSNNFDQYEKIINRAVNNKKKIPSCMTGVWVCVWVDVWVGVWVGGWEVCRWKGADALVLSRITPGPIRQLKDWQDPTTTSTLSSSSPSSICSIHFLSTYPTRGQLLHFHR